MEHNCYENILKNLDENGVHIFGEILDKEAIGQFFEKIKKNRDFSDNIFLTRESYQEKTASHKGVNPSVDFNHVNHYQQETQIIEQNDILTDTLQRLLGKNYHILLKKFVCGVPDLWIPQWIKEQSEGSAVNNLNGFIKPEFRDITHFHGIDFHQDMIDWPKNVAENSGIDPSKMFTLYVYLHDVTEQDSPLFVIPRSHKLGATLFPHKLKLLDMEKAQWQYEDDRNNTLLLQHHVLVGGAGYVALWHNCTLHGTRPIAFEAQELPCYRLSLRYLIVQTDDTENDIAKINANIDGTLQMQVTRNDVDKKGIAKTKTNTINKL
ncbi:MAG: phytanoyl-CoA dioxygenase family protein [Alphaproteobacteria bacterium]|nr:phytanoyl-CoA dioxygenase family protein [Alphaproteobacteria bacterium]